MLLENLSLARFRGFASAELHLAPGVNLFTGGNGAGKTTLLEAAHLLANGRSFRGRVRDGLIQHGESHLEVFATWHEASGRSRRAGLHHTGRTWEARLDSEPVGSLAELCAALAVLSFEPGTHELIAGGSEQRRRFLDWALFHVEPSFLPLWRRYSRALKQRNMLLKGQPETKTLDAWDAELCETGEPLTRMRALYLAQLEPLLAKTAALYLPELGASRLVFLSGWGRDGQSLADALLQSRTRDTLLGHSGTGPHRADWQIAFEGLPGRIALSRGQEKLVALSCVLAQARTYALVRNEWPIIALDDFASELDELHQNRVLEDIHESGAQVLLTGTTSPRGLLELLPQTKTFHVEHGNVRPLL